ncbi:MAG: metalloregulator ArsR/SmtB family transcription factor [Spirochaetes bacterium]|jgi:ArsR family transcriptional regulator|nr:metalloregulator ArsR/SmtB family transcription factor [Spirochaetota bacterium]
MKTKCDVDYENYAELLKAIGHPVRLQIVAGILCDECNVNGIVEKLNIPQSTVSQHLGVLRSRGIITAHKEGVSTCYKVSNDFVLHIIRLMKS